ncbi:hypothetical protein DSO57_1004422 [Entomophthora muscae]|uniref:Uncharacterized protein n=1 Tax=Entomophthora muscae TaxID=34485 RepID=A0ACC2TIS9_9FUNG|nr:hypothetical protein DSO57_1004422 [Entomophthora muscae]
MFRHGDRTPVTKLPNNLGQEPYICQKPALHRYGAATEVQFNLPCENGKYCTMQQGISSKRTPKAYDLETGTPNAFVNETCKLGQLTPLGIKQMYDLGTSLRQVYPSLISDIFVRSTDKERTLQSASAVLGGLLPNNQTPVPIAVVPMETDTLVFGHSSCPREKHIANKLQANEIPKIYAWYNPTHRQIESILGKTVADMYQGLYYTDNLRPRHCHNRSQITTSTGKITNAMLHAMHTLFNIQNRITHRDSADAFPAATRLRIGSFLLELKRNLLLQISRHANTQYIIPSMPTPKFLLFSAHDLSISALLSSLQSPDLK